MILGWAAGTWVTYGLSAIVALVLLGRAGDAWRMPHELRMVAWCLGLPGKADAGVFLWLGGSLLIGIALGGSTLWLRRRAGKPPIGLGYRSPAAARSPAERVPATMLALSAGVGEEVFFRLLLPLLIAIVTGSAAFGFVVSLVAFTLLHRHQGRVGMIAVALVGGWLTYLYLLTGALWLVAAVHVLIDVHALVLRPWISGGAVSS
jgi:membrane protease YdiL (CAAX protease family)